MQGYGQKVSNVIRCTEIRLNMKIINKLCAKIVNSNSDDVNETKIPQNSDDGKGLDLESALGLIPGQGPKEKVPDEILIELFKYFFMPNIDFYSEEGNPKYSAYFNVLNAAKYEMFTQKNFLRKQQNGHRMN